MISTRHILVAMAVVAIIAISRAFPKKDGKINLRVTLLAGIGVGFALFVFEYVFL